MLLLKYIVIYIYMMCICVYILYDMYVYIYIYNNSYLSTVIYIHIYIYLFIYMSVTRLQQISSDFRWSRPRCWICQDETNNEFDLWLNCHHIFCSRRQERWTLGNTGRNGGKKVENMWKSISLRKMFMSEFHNVSQLWFVLSLFSLVDLLMSGVGTHHFHPFSIQ